MITPKQDRQTRQIEMVETYNIALSLKRLNNAAGYDSRRWKRAFYHALAMSGISHNGEIEKIRQAIELP